MLDSFVRLKDILSDVPTPAFVWDESQLRNSAENVAAIARQAGCTLLYTLKPLTMGPAVGRIGRFVSGFAASSLFEARLGKECSSDSHTIHICAPAYRSEELPLLAQLCDYITFNSLNQLKLFDSLELDGPERGLRINPRRSLVADPRYDPCRRFSHLGVSINDLVRSMSEQSLSIDGISGIHVHTNCDSTNLGDLLSTVQDIDRDLGTFLSKLAWINLGGGYLFEEAESLKPFVVAVNLLTEKYGLKVFIEPGAALARKAGYLVATVLDVLRSDARDVAILDTTVNHAPEVFEYQFVPPIVGATENGAYPVLLAGRSCLAGDIFGAYTFDTRVTVGTRIVFADMGAYSSTKWHMFNGINLPTVYCLTEDNGLVVNREFTYLDFASLNGVQSDAII